MMNKITLEQTSVLNYLDIKNIMSMQTDVSFCHDMIHKGTGKGSEYLGWVDFPHGCDKQEIESIKTESENIRRNSDVLIVIGIGGSFLGAKAAINMLNHTFYNELTRDKRGGPKIYFAGHNMSTDYLTDLFDVIDNQDLSVNVISKSGTTTEPAIVFRKIKEYMYRRYSPDEARKRIIVTTDKDKGALKELSDKEGYKSFTIPGDVGGRYSVLTAVGLLPMAVAGIDIDEILSGSQAACKDLSSDSIEDNHAYRYAVIRNLLYQKGLTTEILAGYKPSLFYFGEWYKQLFGESEGKEGKGIFPAYLSYTTDLHSMGQYVQDGKRNLFETILNVEKPQSEIVINKDDENLDGLNYLDGKSLDYVNRKAMEGALLAHVQGGVPNMVINIPEISPYYFGYLVYFFQKACAMSGYLLGVNPFDQPGVEEYKSNMFRLLDRD